MNRGLAFALPLVLAACQPSPQATDEAPTTAAPPSYSVVVLSVECSPNYGRPRADVTIRNTGQAIPYAKGFVQFTDDPGNVLSAQDNYFSPTTIPSGAVASMTTYASGGGATHCGLAAIQDGDGNPVVVSAAP